MFISNCIVSNKILEFIKIYAIKSYTNNEKLLLLIKEVVLKVIYWHLSWINYTKSFPIFIYSYYACVSMYVCARILFDTMPMLYVCVHRRFSAMLKSVFRQ